MRKFILLLLSIYAIVVFTALIALIKGNLLYPLIIIFLLIFTIFFLDKWMEIFIKDPVLALMLEEELDKIFYKKDKKKKDKKTMDSKSQLP